MSKHPLDAVSLAFGTVFVVMALVGLAEAAGVVDEGLVTTLIGVVVMVAVIGFAVSIRRMSSDKAPRPDSLEEASPPADVPPTGPVEDSSPAPDTPAGGITEDSAPANPTEDDDSGALRL